MGWNSAPGGPSSLLSGWRLGRIAWLECLEIGDDRFRIGAVHVIWRHRRARRLSIGSKPRHKELHRFLVIPTRKACYVRCGVGPDGNRHQRAKLQLFALQPLVHHEAAGEGEW